MSREAWGDPPESQEPPQVCPVCGGEWHAEGCEFGEEVSRRLKARRTRGLTAPTTMPVGTPHRQPSRPSIVWVAASWPVLTRPVTGTVRVPAAIASVLCPTSVQALLTY